ncbi:hypothetical protein [Deinococcus hopiensis]|uniref:Uncharacterized protein n=1 Tax=Deinococcus hopiensis KR-140 TaxID=695939 RepID=A0A1W1UXV8_9DEIO|nr:hypothetical protein [Deinococcus hopiensis]SMB85899.1 hypothetical protein SAMN00790413_03592 [Deinococcus hopiensis KR-140]
MTAFSRTPNSPSPRLKLRRLERGAVAICLPSTSGIPQSSYAPVAQQTPARKRREHLLPLTPPEHNGALWTAVHAGTLFYRLDPRRSPTAEDADRWLALTGREPYWFFLRGEDKR